jgi:hypothetical protein
MLILKKTRATSGLPITRILEKMTPGPLPLLYLQIHCLQQWPLFWGQEFRFAEGKVREGLCFWHLLSTDGLEISYTAMCPADNCPVHECPKDQLDRTNNRMIFQHGSKSNLWSKSFRLSCWIQLGVLRTAAKPRYFYIWYHFLYHIYLGFIPYIASYRLELTHDIVYMLYHMLQIIQVS